MYQENRHSSYCNHESIVDVNGRVGYRSHNSHSSSHNPGVCGRFFCVFLIVFLTKKFMVMKEVKVVVMMEDMNLGINITATIPSEIM